MFYVVECCVVLIITCTKDSRKISFPSLPSAGNGMDEIHTDVGGAGHKLAIFQHSPH
jgi:hypothetical protein